MTANKLVTAMAKRAAELADMKLPDLRREHPDSQDSDVGAPPEHVRKTGRGDIIHEILVEEFLFEFDREIDE